MQKTTVQKTLTRFLIDGANAANILPLLHEDGRIVRLYRHWPTAEMSWWTVSVPVARGGPNRDILLQGLEYDMEISRAQYIEWIDDFRSAGMTLVQSPEPLPYSLHPGRFHSPAGFEAVLKKCGAMLLFELPHADETAGLTVFSARHADWIRRQGVALRDDA
ncbi:hypothetical protein [Roseovarius ramblicola]|uniref:Uncharacterized protein n=1 Tax=Roseovarius ramblicola TaxID=2022336 RepID=A0ABV5HUV3_9RHOB